MIKFKILLILLLLGCFTTSAQNKQLLYDFKEIPQALLLNPGIETNYNWYSGVPILSGLSVQAGFSGITAYDLFADDGIDINTKVREKVINGMSINDEISGAFQIELLNAGFRDKNNPNNFYSFGMYLEGDAIGYWFKDIAVLLFDGNANQLDRKFNLGHLKTKGEMVNVFHFGLNKKISNSLTIGARAKLYSGILNFDSTKNSGYFQTTEGQNNFFANTIDADIELRSSGILSDDENSSSLVNKTLLGGNLGLGLDAGFTYNLNNKSVITGSLLDVGFVYQTKDIENHSLRGNTTIEGVEIILPLALLNPNFDLWGDLIEDVKTEVPYEKTEESYLTFRPTKLYASYRYNFGENSLSAEDCKCNYMPSKKDARFLYVNSAGLQLYAINRPRGPQTAVSAFYQRRFGNAISVKGTYTMDKFTKTNVGLGVNMQIGSVNFYAMADNLLAYKNIADTHYASFQLGLNIISW